MDPQQPLRYITCYSSDLHREGKASVTKIKLNQNPKLLSKETHRN